LSPVCSTSLRPVGYSWQASFGRRTLSSRGPPAPSSTHASPVPSARTAAPAERSLQAASPTNRANTILPPAEGSTLVISAVTRRPT